MYILPFVSFFPNHGQQNQDDSYRCSYILTKMCPYFPISIPKILAQLTSPLSRMLLIKLAEVEQKARSKLTQQLAKACDMRC